MNKRIRVRVHDSMMGGTFADKTIEKLTPGDPTIIGRDVERLIARLLNTHHARRHRVAAEELALSDRLGAAWITVATTLDALDRVVREAEGMDRKIAAPTVPFATAAASKSKDNSATAAAGISRNPFATAGNPFVATVKGGMPVTAADRVRAQQKICAEFWKPRES